MIEKKTLNSKLIQFRKGIKENSSLIVENILLGNTKDVCFFCGTGEDITREHVLPQWLFEKSTDDFYVNSGNGAEVKYHKSTLPACNVCNNEILSDLESYILANLRFPYNPSDLDIFILWLEILCFKFQAYDYSLRFIKNFSNNDFIPFLKDFSLGELRNEGHKRSLRRSINRLKVKGKEKSSFIFFKSTNKGKHFFHKIDEFIFIESPRLGCAVFYFFDRKFRSEEEAHQEAMKVIDEVY